MVCLITKVETNRAIQKPQWNNQIHRQGKQATKTKKFWQTRKKSRQQNKRKKQKSNQLNTVSTEHIAQTTQSTNKSEENKEQRANNTITTRTYRGKQQTSNNKKVITDQTCYGSTDWNFSFKNICSVAVHWLYIKYVFAKQIFEKYIYIPEGQVWQSEFICQRSLSE